MNETDFTRTMELKATAKEWKAMECIQTCIKLRIGYGKHIQLNFKMDLDMKL